MEGELSLTGFLLLLIGTLFFATIAGEIAAIIVFKILEWWID